MPERIHLISFDTCPYVERSRVVLEEKGLDYDVTFIDLRKKPDWFLAISPRGKVPVLVVDDEPIFESTVINEYLEEAFPEPSLFPADPRERAQARSWTVFANDAVMPAFYSLIYAKQSETERIEKASGEMRELLVKVDAELARRGRKFFVSDEFGLIDAIWAPIFSRLEALRQLGRAAAFEGLEHVEAYGERVVSHGASMRGRADNLTAKTVKWAMRD